MLFDIVIKMILNILILLKNYHGNKRFFKNLVKHRLLRFLNLVRLSKMYSSFSKEQLF